MANKKKRINSLKCKSNAPHNGKVFCRFSLRSPTYAFVLKFTHSFTLYIVRYVYTVHVSRFLAHTQKTDYTTNISNKNKCDRVLVFVVVVVVVSFSIHTYTHSVVRLCRLVHWLRCSCRKSHIKSCKYWVYTSIRIRFFGTTNKVCLKLLAVPWTSTLIPACPSVRPPARSPTHSIFLCSVCYFHVLSKTINNFVLFGRCTLHNINSELSHFVRWLGDRWAI